jgi:hypothetical protein
MIMKRDKILTTSFIVASITLIIGSWLKVVHYPGANTCLTVGLIAWLSFIIAAIYEVRTSNKVNETEKTIWTVAFILFSGITGLLYILFGRKRVTS